MEMRHVKTFCAIVKYGSFSKAAHVLGYAQSTVTAHMKALENDLHIPLFDRLGKKVLLTKAGHQFHPYALELLAIYEKAQEIPQNGDYLEGTLSITSNESLAVYRLPQLLRTYKQKNPKVNIVLETNTNEQALQKLREGETDVIFIIGESIEHNDFITRTFCKETFGWILLSVLPYTLIHFVYYRILSLFLLSKAAAIGQWSIVFYVKAEIFQRKHLKLPMLR